MSQFGTTSAVNFVITAKDVGASATFAKIGADAQKLSQTMDAVTLASGRDIKKAFRKGGLDDVFQAMGLTQNGLKTLTTAVVAIKSMEAALNGMSAVMDGIASGKKASEIWTDFAKGIPILGVLATAADRAGQSLGNLLFQTGEFQKRAEEQEKGIRSGAAARAGIAADARTAAERIAVEQARASGGDIAARRLQTRQGFQRELEDLRKRREAMTVSGMNRGEIAGQLLTIESSIRMRMLAAETAFAKESYEEETRKFMEEEKKKEDATKERLKQQEKDRVEAAKAALERREQGLEAGLEQLLGRREALFFSASASRSRGALAGFAGVGAAAQLASRSRASADPAIKIAKDQVSRLDKLIKLQEDAIKELRRGNTQPVTPIFVS